MPSIYAREKVLLGKAEQVYGQEEALDAAADAIRTLDCTISWDKSTEETREDGPGIDHGPQEIVKESVKLDFKTYASGSGAGGTTLPYGWLLKLFGLQENLSAGPPGTAAYTLVSVADSATLGYANGPNRHPVVGARGASLRLDMTAGKLAMWEMGLRGLKLPPINQAFPGAIDVSGYNKSVRVNFANTTVANLLGFDVQLVECVFDFGLSGPHIDAPNIELIDITGRGLTAKVKFLDPGIGVHNFYALDGGDLGNFNVTHDDGMGGVLKAGSAAGAQLSITDVGEYEGRSAISADVRITKLPTTGLPDFSIVNEYAA